MPSHCHTVTRLTQGADLLTLGRYYRDRLKFTTGHGDLWTLLCVMTTTDYLFYVDLEYCTHVHVRSLQVYPCQPGAGGGLCGAVTNIDNDTVRRIQTSPHFTRAGDYNWSGKLTFTAVYNITQTLMLRVQIFPDLYCDRGLGFGMYEMLKFTTTQSHPASSAWGTL